MDLERFTNHEFDGYWLSGTNRDLFQMLDTSINIIDGYMYISFGRSYKQLVNADHNYQQMRLVRVEMDKLPETKGWDASNVADPTRAVKLEIETQAQTIFKVYDTFRLGGTIRETDFNGNVRITEMEKFYVVPETLDMTKIGKQTVTLMNKYGTAISYEIEVTCETEYYCLDGGAYSVPFVLGKITYNGIQRQYGDTITQAGDYIVVTNPLIGDKSTKIMALYYTGDTTGDKTQDEEVNIIDLIRMKKGIVDDTVFTKAGRKASDMNEDNQINSQDLVLLRKMLLSN
jgi:hypothetical protein